MNNIQEKAKELLTKELGREPTPEEVNKYLAGSGLLMANGSIQDAKVRQDIFENYSNLDLD